MSTRVYKSLLVLSLVLVTGYGFTAESWPQFRGVSGSSRARSQDPLPQELGPATNVIWKTPLPSGHSSPVVFGDRIYLTAVQGESLLTLALDRADGRVVWEAEAPHTGLEQIHSIGSHAQSTPATDGERIVTLFGSCGLFCYDLNGKLLWHRPMGPFNNDFGAASSPVLAEDRVILCQDHDTNSFITAIDKHTGRTIWKTERSEFLRNYCTPLVVEVEGKKQIIVAATLRVVGYDFATGQELWTVRNIARAVSSSPGVSDDGTVYIASFAAGGEPGERIQVAPFAEVVQQRDANQNGLLEPTELPEGDPFLSRFAQVDRDKSGTLTAEEFEYFRGLFDKSRNVVLALRPGGSGDVTQSHVVWEYSRHVPFIASPVFAHGQVFMVKDGGIVSSLDGQTGKLGKTQRVPGTAAYYSSPVAGDNKIYLLDERGQLTVISAQPDWQVLSTADFSEDVYATPAIVDGRIYLRTAGNLFCFGLPRGTK